MMRSYKIVKEIHTYNGKTVFRIYEKSFFKWLPFDDVEYETIESAEFDLIKHINGKHGGIIKIDGNVYSFYPVCFPLP